MDGTDMKKLLGISLLGAALMAGGAQAAESLRIGVDVP